jgi:signal transduction histidine kinase
MNTLKNLSISLPMFVSLLVATGSLLVLMFLGAVGLSGLEFFRFTLDIDHERDVMAKPAEIAEGVKRVIDRETRSCWNAVASRTFFVTSLEQPFLIESLWVVDAGNREIHLVSGSHQRLVRYAEHDNWANALVRGDSGASASTSLAALENLVAGKTFSRVEVKPLGEGAGTVVVVMETEIGVEPAMKRGAILRRNILFDRIVNKYLNIQRTDNHMAIELIDASGNQLLVARPGSDGKGPVDLKEIGADSVMTSPEFDGVLAGTRLRISHCRDFGRLMTPEMPILSKGVLVAAALVLAGTICFFYYKGKTGEAGLALQNDWIANLAHTVRGPVHAIGVLTEALPQASGDAQIRMLSLIRGEVEVMDRTFRQFMRLARAGKNRIELNPAAVNLADLLASTRDRLLIRYPKHTAASILFEGVSAQVVSADPEACREVIETALDNALKYSPKGTPITVKAESCEGSVVIRIVDQGIGLSAGDLANVGQAFFRGSGEGTDGIVGTGLGVYLATLLCTSMGGGFSLTSDGPRKGACATIILPKA